MRLLSFDLFNDGSGTNLLSNGDATTTPIKPTIETAELISKTGGVFVVIEKDECNTGLLLANNSVMKPMVTSPLRYESADRTSTILLSVSSKRIDVSDIRFALSKTCEQLTFCVVEDDDAPISKLLDDDVVVTSISVPRINPLVGYTRAFLTTGLMMNA
jgi:hypothetical protein